MKKVQLGLIALSVSLLLVSCSDNNETVETTEVVTKEVSAKIIESALAAGLNANYIHYGDFYFPDGTKEERLFVEEDIVMTEEQLFQIAENAQADPTSRQYRTFNLVAQNTVIDILGYTGNDQFGLSQKGRTALQWAVNNYNNLSGVNISFRLTYGTNHTSSNIDMVVYDNSVNTPSNRQGGSAGFPTNTGRPHKYIQIFNLGGYTTNANEHVITHEIGHAVGFRHTDWFSRQSCGETGEAAGSIGAVHINNTPTGYDSTSIMLACFNSGTNGEFNNNDKTALRNMY